MSRDAAGKDHELGYPKIVRESCSMCKGKEFSFAYCASSSYTEFRPEDMDIPSMLRSNKETWLQSPRFHFANDKTKKITLFTSFNPTKQVAHVKNIFYMAGGNGICTNIAHDTFVPNVKRIDLVEHLLLWGALRNMSAQWARSGPGQIRSTSFQHGCKIKKVKIVAWLAGIAQMANSSWCSLMRLSPMVPVKATQLA